MQNDRIKRLMNAARPGPTQNASFEAEFNRLAEEDPTLQGKSQAVRAKRAALRAELHERNGTAAWIRAARNP